MTTPTKKKSLAGQIAEVLLPVIPGTWQHSDALKDHARILESKWHEAFGELPFDATVRESIKSQVHRAIHTSLLHEARRYMDLFSWCLVNITFFLLSSIVVPTVALGLADPLSWLWVALMGLAGSLIYLGLMLWAMSQLNTSTSMSLSVVVASALGLARCIESSTLTQLRFLRTATIVEVVFFSATCIAVTYVAIEGFIKLAEWNTRRQHADHHLVMDLLQAHKHLGTRDGARYLERTAQDMELFLPNLLKVGNEGVDTTTRKHCSEVAAAFRTLASRAILASVGTQDEIRSEVLSAFLNAARGNWGDLKRESIPDAAPRQRWAAKIATTIRSLVVGATPIGGIYLFRAIGAEPKGTFAEAFWVLSMLWVVYHVVRAFEPQVGERLAEFRALTETIKPFGASKKE